MGTFPSAALSIRPPEDPLSQYAKALSVKSMIQGQQTTQLQQTGLEQENQMRQQQILDQQAMTKAMHDWDGQSYQTLVPLAKQYGASATTLLKLNETILGQAEKKSTIAKNDAETGGKQLDTLAKGNDMLLGHLNTILEKDDSGNPVVSDDQLATRINQEKNAALVGGYLDKNHADMIDQIIATNDPQKIRGSLGIFEKGLMGEKEQFDQAQKEREAAVKEWKEVPGTGMFYNLRTSQVKTPAGVTMTPAQMESKYVQLTSDAALGKPVAKEDQAFVNSYAKFKTMVPAFNFNMAGGATGGLDQAAIDQQAERYFQTGQLPPVGRGVYGLALVHTIMQRATQMHPGESLSASSAAFKANQVSLDNLQKTFDQVSAFEGTALRNLDLYVKKAQAIPDLGVKFANVPLRSITASMVGAGNLAAMNAARQTAATETAKVLGSATASGILSDSQKKEALDVLDGNLPLSATIQVVETLKQDFANRHDSYTNQIADIKGRLGAKAGGGGGAAKTLTQAQIAQAAKDHNVSVEEAARQAKAAGYEVKP